MDAIQLCRTAVIDCAAAYTYGQMFSLWEQYARVFSALDMTEHCHARVGIAGTISAEPLFAFFGLNMTGAEVSMLSYPDFLPGGYWKTMVEREHLTDLILSDIMITPEQWPLLLQAKQELGLHNIILLHTRLGGPCTGPAEMIYNEYNYHALKNIDDTVFMDDLLKQYAGAPITYGSNDPDRIAIITHTSGTTKGTRKPLPYTNRSMNTVLTNYGSGYHQPTEPEGTQFRYLASFDFSSFLSISSMNSYFCNGDTVVLTFFGFLHPKFIRAVDYYKINVLFTSGFMIDSWLQRSDIDEIDFSSLKVFSCGGSYLPSEKLKKYRDFLRKHGYTGGILRGYGMSETGGARIRLSEDSMEDILGYPVPPENFRFLDETDQKFYKVEDGVRTGVMYIASDSLCKNELDGEVLFEYTVIDGRNFICTNDLVRVNRDGSLSYAGRADRFFVNNEGVRFEAGIVETELAKHPGIHQCAIVPVLDKRIHDTVPVLYVVPDETNHGLERVRQALNDVYIIGGLSKRSSLPSQLILVNEIPCNSNGKIDVYRITRERLKGNAYDIMPVMKQGKLTDIKMKLTEEVTSNTGGTLPEGMGRGSALGIYEVFNKPAVQHKTADWNDLFQLILQAVK